MNPVNERVAYNENNLFKIVQRSVPDREQPYEYVRRRGAVTVLPILTANIGNPQVLLIQCKQPEYETRLQLPGGNLDGDLNDPEPAIDAARRELQEETGYGYSEETRIPKVDGFWLQSGSRTIRYDRFFVVMRGVVGIGGKRDDEAEIVTLEPAPLNDFLEPLVRLRYASLPAEVNCAFAKAAMELGTQSLRDWLIDGSSGPSSAVAKSFEPWLTQI